MELIHQNQQNGAFGARGACPHCSLPSLHMLVPSPHILPAGTHGRAESNVLVQCQNCHGITFVVGVRHPLTGLSEYKESFPVGNPEAAVDKNIPAGVRGDFVEALRCGSVTAYKATVVMCRRAIQASCKNLNAKGDKLIHQIDDLAARGAITNVLKEMAHEIRKLGNAGAHPDDDELADVTKDDADDIIEFTDQYFEHIYVMPARMQEMRKRRETPQPTSPK